MDAKIFFGSNEATKEEYSERKSPYNGDVVSRAPICDESDANKALEIAKEAAREAKKTTLSQRCDWLLDVARKLKENKEDIAQTITDEVGKPIAFARVEVERCRDSYAFCGNYAYYAW